MAQQQAYVAYANTNTDKGTLAPGQTISVNKYTVQVERYLSQGGFAHVYLVRTSTPIYNTTHHVLKRIAVANEAMLSEVRKEVDIMRILKGHPNIVHLIDAAWHRMANGMYEVFILMEYCSGGGIIDMMNRRLRERLTEAEILQIFVDVCEGVAAMHNLRPALLHRDLKVENILQSSPTSFKICDFGSATPVAAKPPSNQQEIRTLEADINRYTTQQYRAPEMIDLFLRRLIDEKSDVWALGVLLYKLCYYTTPFEEHGQLAILNVQYRIPPYPVYSNQMNTLIGSMLREHGTQRPSVFEILVHVHLLRGSKSRFTYNLPPPQCIKTRAGQPSPVPPTPVLENTIIYHPLSSANVQEYGPVMTKSSSSAIQAREKVLEAISPMRRGRPTVSQQNHSTLVSHTPSLQKGTLQTQDKGMIKKWLDDESSFKEDKPLKSMQKSLTSGHPVRLYNFGMAPQRQPNMTSSVPSAFKDAWNIEARASETTDGDNQTTQAGFGDSFAEKMSGTFNGLNIGSTANAGGSEKLPSWLTPGQGSRNTKIAITKGKDAFEGLGLSNTHTTPAPTLGEARKLRTGLAVVNRQHRAPLTLNPSYKPSPSPVPRPTPSPLLMEKQAPVDLSSRSSPYNPVVSATSSSNSPKLQPLTDLPPEARFPSLEELNATFGSSTATYNITSLVHSTTQPESQGRPSGGSSQSPSPAPPLSIRPNALRVPAGLSRGRNGVLSERVAGTVMREAEEPQKRLIDFGDDDSTTQNRSSRPVTRPSLSRKHRSNVAIRPPPQRQAGKDTSGSLSDAASLASLASIRPEPKDWLTGADETLISTVNESMFASMATGSRETPFLREFTSKRSSFIEINNVQIPSPQEAVTSQSSPPQKTPNVPSSPRKKHSKSSGSGERKLPEVSTSTSPKKDNELFGSAMRIPYKYPDVPVDNMSPTVSRSPQPDKWGSSSSGEDGPDDAIGFAPPKLAEKTDPTRRRKTKGRQSSVHDLVDLWGGGVVHTKERDKSCTQSPANTAFTEPVLGTKLQQSRSLAGTTFSKPRSTSPQPMLSRTLDIPTHATTNSNPSPASPKRLSTSQHTKQMSTFKSTSSTAATVSTAPGRFRPQSMFVFPMSGSNSEGIVDIPSIPTGLAVPHDKSQGRTSRRTSITDMVQRYEAIGSKDKGPASGLIPVVPTLAAFKTVNPSSAGVNRRSEEIKTQETSTSSTRALPSKPTLDTTQTLQPPNPSPTRRAPSPVEDTRSQSPDKPYQGVGKLIDQWQRKTADNGVPRDPVSRRGGILKRGPVSGGALRG
ncbi:hypothetical protein SERLA73DRAFT_68122 [Serpula lacrymans var. lacrymans S7.3]|uniref:non-specific serine/threonine protein kinase n=1 Tax=Serpula lacrymans var. lacrymans (strain S7.3) TaxID=936435 RepID=F8PGZ9_SERL3|nr:hypothetical protein SERLA73DRAFT_68122 [Serpula lacrymans var. lacrymans S7.3]